MSDFKCQVNISKYLQKSSWELVKRRICPRNLLLPVMLVQAGNREDQSPVSPFLSPPQVTAQLPAPRTGWHTHMIR